MVQRNRPEIGDIKNTDRTNAAMTGAQRAVKPRRVTGRRVDGAKSGYYNPL